MNGHGRLDPVEPSNLELMAIFDDPDYGKSDPLTRYMSMRENGDPTRQEYLRGHDKKSRFTHESDRISKLRVEFFANPTKQDLVASHEERWKEWRKEAMDKQSQNLHDLETRLWKFENNNPIPGKETTKKRNYLKNEKRILEAISKWPKNEDYLAPVEPTATPEARDGKGSYGLKACIMHFKKGRGGHTHKHRHPEVIGEFPNQKIAIEHLLSDANDNPLKDECKSNMLRYFHLPTNNMAWVEKFLTCYYDEGLPLHDSRKPPHKRGPAERLLAREYWKGQMHGGAEHPVHARHMRPRFSSVPSFSAPTTYSPMGSVVPSRRTSTTGFQRDQSPPSSKEPVFRSSTNFTLFMPYLHWETNSRRARMAEVVEEITKGKKNAGAAIFHAAQIKLRAKYGWKVQARTKCLGPYLMSIAKLYDAMDYEADERLLRDHLHEKPPLHIRRTLDQSYFWTLEDTTSRDKDQVVYRGTRGGTNWNARVVMVDQLWLWILDEHTILTSFPRRWGRNKPDPSGVHKSLRERLSHLEDDQINSVFDLALIIIDQCSRVFFDRTLPTDQRPEVMDIFSNTIAHVTGMKTVAFETFWDQMRMDSLKDPLTQSEKSVRAYLNVNPEGALLREAQDIVEELRMMSRIFTLQYQVVKDFKKALEKLNEKEDRKQGPESERQLRNILEDSRMVMGESEGDGMRFQYSRVPKSTMLNAEEVLDRIIERRAEIEELEEAAKRISQQLQDLLALKQQQASIIEARMAIKRADLSINQADLSIRQGRSIMLFTVVTIFFLPLSFFTSIFGMNTSNWNNTPLSLHQIFRFMFPISFAVITICFLIAFSFSTRALASATSGWIRALFSMLFTVFWARILEYVPIYWIKERKFSISGSLSTRRFMEIQQTATKKISEIQNRKLAKRDRDEFSEEEDKRKIDEQKEREKEGREFERTRRRGKRSGGAFNGSRDAEEVKENGENVGTINKVFSKDGEDGHMV